MKRKVLMIGAVATATLLVTGWALAQSHGRGFGPPFMQTEGAAGMGGGMMQHMGRMGPGMMHGGGGGHGGGHAGELKGDSGPSSLAFRGINTKMHEGMNITFTGAADVDFVKGMIPHHQGAVEMAKTVLAFGRDPEVRKLAEAVISAQEGEIALMQEWLKKNNR